MKIITKKIIFIILAIVVFIAAIFFLVLPYLFVENHTHIEKVAVTKYPNDYNLPFENLRVITSDGINLIGWHIPVKNPKGTMILCHGLLINKGDILQVASDFYKAGYESYLFDFRNHGDSDKSNTTYGLKEPKDIKAIVQYIRTKGKTRIGIWGISMGGAIVLMASKDNPEIKVFIVDSAYATLENMLIHNLSNNRAGLITLSLVNISKFYSKNFFDIPIDDIKPINSVQHLNRPVLFISGTKDHVVPVENTIEMYKQASSPKEIYLFKNVDHRETMNQSEYAKLITSFCDKYLK